VSTGRDPGPLPPLGPLREAAAGATGNSSSSLEKDFIPYDGKPVYMLA